jgi:hypothetical protein
MGFLSSLGNIINTQFGIGENTSHSLDTVSGGAYSRLGDYANKIDQTAERNYIVGPVKDQFYFNSQIFML